MHQHFGGDHCTQGARKGYDLWIRRHSSLGKLMSELLHHCSLRGRQRDRYGPVSGMDITRCYIVPDRTSIGESHGMQEGRNLLWTGFIHLSGAG